MNARVGAKAGLLLAAGLSGAAGMGLEVLIISLAGPVVGHGRAGALGIALFVAGWAGGARLSAGVRRPSRALLFAGLVVCAAALLGPRVLLVAGAASPSAPIALGLAALTLMAVAIPQGSMLPLLARPFEARGRFGLAPIVAANLLGAALGAELFGDRLPASQGRLFAAAAAGLMGLAAGGLGAAAWWRVGGAGASGAQDSRSEAAAPKASGLDLRVAGWLLALFVGWGASIELCALRLGVLWLGGMQAALGSVLVASLLALALGAAVLPALLPRGPRGLAGLFGLCMLGPLTAFVPELGVGALPQSAPTLARALALVGPMLAPFGAALPVLHRELARRDDGSLGRLLGYEALGVLIGMPITHLLLIPRLGLVGAIVGWAPLAALAGLVALRRLRAPALAFAPVGAAAALLALQPWLEPPALSSPPLSNPALTIHAFDEDEHFAVSVIDDGLLGERTLMTDGFRAAGTGASYRYMRALGHLPLLLHPAPKRVCVLAFGTGTTAGAVSRHAEVESIEVLELSGTVIDDAPWFEAVNGGVLQQPGERVRVTLGDGRRTLAEREGAYDVLTMEPLLPSSPFGVYLYTREFYARARRALAPGGLLCQWVPPHALEPVVFAAVLDGFARSFEWSGLFLSGTQLLLVGAELEPALSNERFAGLDPGLRAALAEVGLESRAGLAARFIGTGGALDHAPRPLTDADPWIIYPRAARGARALALLPENLASLRVLEQDPPSSWSADFDESMRRRLEGLEAARRAREALAVRSAEQAGATTEAANPVRDLAGELRLAVELAPDDAGVRALALEIELVSVRRNGLIALASSPGAGGGRAALPDLVRAVELAPERADGHLYLAVALERIGDLDSARKALARALELCPRIAETRAGEQARRLGFPATGELSFRE